jgi:hypothetical protein
MSRCNEFARSRQSSAASHVSGANNLLSNTISERDMIEKTENKIKAIYFSWKNEHKQKAAKLVRALTKIELFYLVSSHNYLACPELMGNRERQLCLENFVCSALEGAYAQ